MGEGSKFMRHVRVSCHGVWLLIRCQEDLKDDTQVSFCGKWIDG